MILLPWEKPGWRVPEACADFEHGIGVSMFAAGAIGDRLHLSDRHSCGPLKEEIGITAYSVAGEERSIVCVVRLEDLEWAVAELRRLRGAR